jgi:hypothetical protein
MYQIPKFTSHGYTMDVHVLVGYRHLVVMLVVASSKIASSRRRHLVLFGHVPFWGRSLCWQRHRLLPVKLAVLLYIDSARLIYHENVKRDIWLSKVILAIEKSQGPKVTDKKLDPHFPEKLKPHAFLKCPLVYEKVRPKAEATKMQALHQHFKM